MAKYYVRTNQKGEFWFKDLNLKIRHRNFGPAVCLLGRGESWFQDGKRHRVDGPAFTDSVGNERRYYLDDGRYSKEEHEQMITYGCLCGMF